MTFIKRASRKILTFFVFITLGLIDGIQAQNCSGSWADDSHPIAPPLNCFVGQVIGGNTENPFPACPINPNYTATQINTFTFTSPVGGFSIDFTAFSITAMVSGCPRMEMKINNVFYPLTSANLFDLTNVSSCSGVFSLIAITPDGYITGNGTAGNVKGTIMISGVNATSVTISTNDLGGTIFSNPYNCMSVIPVKLISFAGIERDACKAILNWTTGVESNVKSIEVLRSANANDFEKVADIMAKGSDSKYTVEINNYTEAFFKLKIIDYDGYYEYSEILKIKSNCNSLGYHVSPNPTGDFINITGLKKNDRVLVLDMFGRVVFSFVAPAINNKFDVQKLSSGMYYLQVLDRETGKGNIKFIKN